MISEYSGPATNLPLIEINSCYAAAALEKLPSGGSSTVRILKAIFQLASLPTTIQQTSPKHQLICQTFYPVKTFDCIHLTRLDGTTVAPREYGWLNASALFQYGDKINPN
jgi:hypothetical protein